MSRINILAFRSYRGMRKERKEMANPDDQIIEDEEVVEQPLQDDAPQEEVQPEEQESEAPVVDEQEPVEEESPQEEAPAEQPPSRREQLRIQDLLQKYGPPQERQAPQNQGIDYRTMIDAPDEVYDQLGQATQNYGQQQYSQGLQEANKVRFETRLEVDAPKVATKYPQLDKDSEEFNPAVANSINQMYLSAVGYDPNSGSVQNPNLRYAEYADAIFELADEAANRKVETSRRNITRQAAQTGLRPDGSSAKTVLDLNKAPSAMSDKELDAILAREGLNPKKRG